MALGVKAANQLLTLKADETQQLAYLAAVGEYKLGKLLDARTRLQRIVKLNPDFAQAKNLLQAVEDKMTSDTLVAGGVVAGVVGVTAAVVGGLLMSGGSRK
jgi:catechol-2,3-dioxygenase